MDWTLAYQLIMIALSAITTGLAIYDTVRKRRDGGDRPPRLTDYQLERKFEHARDTYRNSPLNGWLDAVRDWLKRFF